MKTLNKFLIGFFLALSVLSNAQQIVGIEDYRNLMYRDDIDLSQYYFKDLNDDLLPYEGIWRFDNGSEVFELHLERVERFDNFINGFADELMGNYKYIKDGVVIFDTLDNQPTFGSILDGYHFELASFKKDAPLIFSFEDPVNSRWTGYTSILTELETFRGVRKIKMETGISSFGNPFNDPNPQQALRIPETMVLTKVL